MSGFIKFQDAMITVAQEHITPLTEDHRDELTEAMKNHLFDLEGPRQLEHPLNSREQYFGRAFRGFTEISKSLETLDDIAFFIRRFPFEGTKITRERYLQFHVEAHYSEIYILRERLSSYIALFRKQFKRDPQLPNVEQQCNALTNVISGALAGVVEVRGSHIHKVRFTDENIDRLSTIGLLCRGSDSEFSKMMRLHYHDEHKRVRKIWRDRTRDNVSAIRQLLDALFDSLFPMVFEPKTGVLRIPRGIRT